MLHIGIIAGISTAFCWAISGTIHATSSRALGVHNYMLLRQPMVILVLLVLCFFLDSFEYVSLPILGLACLSGVLGIAISDWLLFEAILRVGITAGMVCHSLYVSCTALLGVLFLHEPLGLQGIIGIGIAGLGVILVIKTEHKHLPNINNVAQSNENKIDKHSYKLGILMALSSAIVMALSFITAKKVLNTGMPPLELTLIRNVAACIIFWITALRLSRIKNAVKELLNKPKIFMLILVGIGFGPAGGIWISNIALQNSPVAVASTLIGLQPVAILIIKSILDRCLPSLGASLGSCTACTGAAILLLR